MGPESGSHKVTITPHRWHVRRPSQPVDRSLTRPEAGGFSSQTVSTSASVTFSQGVFPQMMSAPPLLVDTSQALGDIQGRVPSYRLLESMRQYALERLDEAAETKIAQAEPSQHSWKLLLCPGRGGLCAS